jgi:hypothetical protein
MKVALLLLLTLIAGMVPVKNENLSWAALLGDKLVDPYSIVLTSSEKIYTSGTFPNTVSFDPGLVIANLKVAGSADNFVVAPNRSRVLTFYQDSDRDGYGNSSVSIQSTTQPAGYVAQGGDCNDNNGTINPGATETCNGIDDDCNGRIDEGTGLFAKYLDSDKDGYGSSTLIEISCRPKFSGESYRPDDCNDNDAAIHPGATEMCNGKDDDCDGKIDDDCFGTNYTFTGNGLWTDPNNWANGLVPPNNGTLSSGNTITINGITATGEACPPSDNNCNAGVYFALNYGTVIIASGGSLTIPNNTQFSNGGSLIVHGTLINQTTFEGFAESSVTIYGLLINRAGVNDRRAFRNRALMTIKSGGIFRNEVGLLDNEINPYSSTIALNSGGTIENISPSVFRMGKIINTGGTINNAANLTGNATIQGNLNNTGTLAPGNSPGIYNVTGDYTASGSTTHNFEVGGTASNAYDQLLVGGTANLGGILNVTLINGYVPAITDNIPIITGTINGTFSTVNIPSSYLLVYNSNNVVLKKAAVLPVNFVSLEAKKEGNGIQLTWKVQSEQEVMRYEIEKSKEGSVFSSVGSTAASGLSQYSFTDGQGSEEKNYYRIKSIDKDGNYKYSPVISYLRQTIVSPLNVYINQGQNSIIVRHRTTTAGSKITIMAMDGRLIKSVLLKQGAKQSVIELPGIKSGAYLVRFGDGSGKVESAKFIKQ